MIYLDFYDNHINLANQITNRYSAHSKVRLLTEADKLTVDNGENPRSYDGSSTHLFD